MSAQTSEPRIVTPQEAQDVLAAIGDVTAETPYMIGRVRWAHTVATEPDRTRAAVVKALRDYANSYNDWHVGQNADAIENGADF